jgi:hypothetical protein
VVPLTPFSLSYTFAYDRKPVDSEIAAAISVTRTYLNGFCRQRVEGLKELDTTLTDTEYAQAKPFRMDYTARAFFEASADFIPSVGEMDLLLTLAFSGDNLRTYIGLLQQLPDVNIFSTTSDVSDSKSTGDQGLEGVDPKSTSTSQGENGSSKVAIGASLGAGTFIAVLLGILVCRRRESYEEMEKAVIEDGHRTVAGETYMENSTMYSTSYSSSEAESSLHHHTRLVDDIQSEWGLSTLHGITEDGVTEDGESVDQSSEYSTDPLENPLGEYAHYQHIDPLQQHMEKFDQYDSDNESGHLTATSSGGRSEDEEVPMRVVDLIRKFSPLSRFQNYATDHGHKTAST